MNPVLPVTIGRNATADLLRYCHEQRLTRFMLVCDDNTYPVLGQAVEAALRAQGWDVTLACLSGPEVIADERHLVQVLLKADRQERTYIAVGSGTLTDIARFVSHRTRSAFIAMPTAASVDGFTSIGAPLVTGGLKITYPAQPPVALFADLDVLCAAPQILNASGFGDMLGKLLSLADWRLGHVLADEGWDAAIETGMRAAALRLSGYAAEIGAGSPQGIRILMEGLIESGFYMLAFGNSNPAAGAEHHISHFWEMRLLRDQRPAIFHGVKVGIASVLTAGWYAQVRGMSKAQAAAGLAQGSFGTAEAQVQRIRDIYGFAADAIIDDQASFINMSPEALAALKQRILDRWDVVQDIAAQVPSPEQVALWLETAGAPTLAAEIGFDEETVQSALDFSHYLRKRFTINRLRLLLGIPAV